MEGLVPSAATRCPGCNADQVVLPSLIRCHTSRCQDVSPSARLLIAHSHRKGQLVGNTSRVRRWRPQIFLQRALHSSARRHIGVAAITQASLTARDPDEPEPGWHNRTHRPKPLNSSISGRLLSVGALHLGAEPWKPGFPSTNDDFPGITRATPRMDGALSQMTMEPVGDPVDGKGLKATAPWSGSTLREISKL